MSWKRVVATVLLAIAACAQTPKTSASFSVRHFVAPAYPVAAWLARVQGTAVAEVSIKDDGAVDSVKIISASIPLFRDSLDTALTQWSFQTSAATALRVTTRFELDGDCPQSSSVRHGNYYIQTTVTADLPTNVVVKTCLPIISIDTGKSRHQ
ncbi:MAG TPA: energy transducer TonB [Terriglobales bacterium]|nr:energy transducer TonB [Terriglobales bacterium]